MSGSEAKSKSDAPPEGAAAGTETLQKSRARIARGETRGDVGSVRPPRSTGDPRVESDDTALAPNSQPSGVSHVDTGSGLGSRSLSGSGPGGETPTLKELMGQLVAGTVIDNKYTLGSIIGRGGMGIVVAARHVDLGREVALKFLCSGDGSTATEDLRTRFRREAQINAKLKNEHITRVLDVGAWTNTSYIVMERLEGTDLRRKIKSMGGALPLPLAMNYTLQLCEGLAEAHAHGIVHRDLKPANLFVARHTDGSDLIKIMDFGISKWSGGEIGEITRDGTLLGSPKYMAPEQVFGARSIDARADIWSIGAIFYEMVTGRTPYVETTLARLCAALMGGPPPRIDTVKPEVPKRVADVIMKCLESELSNRTPSVAELAGGLLDAVDAPGNDQRARLSAILSLRAFEEGPASSSLMRNLSGSPSRRHVATPISNSLPGGIAASTVVSGAGPIVAASVSVGPGSIRQPPISVSPAPLLSQPPIGIETQATVLDPKVTSASAVAAVPAAPQRSRAMFYVVGGALLLGLGVGFGAWRLSLKSGASTSAVSPVAPPVTVAVPTSTSVATVATAAPPPSVAPLPSATALAVVPSATPSAVAAEPPPATGGHHHRPTAGATPPTAATTAQVAPPPPPKGDDDIPTLR
jgi:serine/threonine-protein kinase